MGNYVCTISQMNSRTCGGILIVFFTIGVFGAAEWYQDEPYFEEYSSNDDATSAQTYNNLHEETWDGSEEFALDNYQQSTNSEMEHSSYWEDTPGDAESSDFIEYDEEPAYSETESSYASESAVDPHWDASLSGSTSVSHRGAPSSGCTLYSYYDPFSFFPSTDPLCSGFFFVFGFFNDPFNVHTDSFVYESYTDDTTVDLVDAPPDYNDSDSPGDNVDSDSPGDNVDSDSPGDNVDSDSPDDTVPMYESGTFETPESPTIKDQFYEDDESAYATDSTQDTSHDRNDPNFHYYSYYTADAS